MTKALEQQIKKELAGAKSREQKVKLLAEIRSLLFELSPFNSQPIDRVIWVHIDEVECNSYNPNSVAPNEMKLLYISIRSDGYTQPVVTVYDPEKKKYVIVDGFHRFTTMKRCEDIAARTGGYLPIVVINKPINDRMASTVRHNRARGKHSVAGMGSMVFEMLENGWTDEAICEELGMEADEIIRLKHVTGFSKLFENVEYRKAWETNRQIKYKTEWKKENGGSLH